VFPGGALVLFGGLLETAGSEAAVVGLLGHELAHLDHGHVLTRIRRIKLAQQSLAHGTAGMTPDRFLELGASSVRIWTRPFQPEDELQADRQGARWAYQAGYDPRETGRLFVEAENWRGVAPLLLPEFLRSHPPAVIRQEAIATVVAELQRQAPQAPLYIGRENLRQRIPKSRREMPSTS
jgi:predicted Zn-dependent protease